MVSVTRTNLRLFVFRFSVASSYVATRVVGHSLSLARAGPAALPTMMAVSAIIVGVVSKQWSVAASSWSLSRLLRITMCGLIAATMILIAIEWVLPKDSFVLGSLYALAELRGCFNMILIATLLNEHLDHQRQRSGYAFVNAGLPLAGMFTGGIMGVGGGSVPVEAVLAMGCLSDVIAIWTASIPPVDRPEISNAAANVLAIESDERAAKERIDELASVKTISKGLSSCQTPTMKAPPREVDSPRQPAKRSLVRSLLGMVVATTLVLTMVGYEWKVVADRLLSHDEALLE